MWAHLLRQTQSEPEYRLRRQKVGVAQVSEHIWRVSFMDFDLGFSDTRDAGWNRSRIRFSRKCYLRVLARLT